MIRGMNEKNGGIDVKKDEPKCMCCNNKARFFVGHPPAELCGVHVKQAEKRMCVFPGGLWRFSRAQIRAALGFIVVHDEQQ